MQSKLLGWLVAHISSKIHLGTISWYPQRQHFINTPVEISSDIFLAFRNRIKCSPVFHRCAASAFDRILVETVDHRIAVGQFLHVPVPFLLSLFSTVIFLLFIQSNIVLYTIIGLNTSDKSKHNENLPSLGSCKNDIS